MADGRPRKHSLSLRGHRTSVTLEQEFWEAFRAIAVRDGLPVNELAARIDDDRAAAGVPGRGLASAIRVYVLKDAQSAAGDPAPDGA